MESEDILETNLTPPEPDEPGMLIFQCNICGAECRFPLGQLGRETSSCARCSSTPRKRAVIEILSRELFGEAKALPDFPASPHLRGLGMTDPHTYARGLAEKFAYENTFFDSDPRLDIMAPLSPEREGIYDFVISSEVLEHVAPPPRRAFENICRLLKPGGLLVLTTPCGLKQATLEHFPDLYDFTITETAGHFELTNMTRAGVVQKFGDLIFHGGPGMTLEMRVFAEPDLLSHLSASGFTSIAVHREPCFRYGIWWPQPFSRPISARKKLAAA